MKLLSRVLLFAVGLAVLSVHAPVSRAEELPMEKRAAAGNVTMEYAGQTFRVNATAAVKLRFEQIDPTTIRLSLVSDDGSSSGKVSIWWVNFSKYVYLGTIPLGEPWTGDLNTEGGFVDR
jgi:hypothetical protein